MACTLKRKTLLREYKTPQRSRFRAYLKEGHSKSRAAHLAKVPQSTTRGWVTTGDRRTGKERPGRPLIISNEKMREITKWMTGYFKQRAMPLWQIANIFDIKASVNTLLAAFARFGYYYHIPNCKPFLSEEHRLKR
jgi:transposase